MEREREKESCSFSSAFWTVFDCERLVLHCIQACGFSSDSATQHSMHFHHHERPVWLYLFVIFLLRIYEPLLLLDHYTTIIPLLLKRPVYDLRMDQNENILRHFSSFSSLSFCRHRLFLFLLAPVQEAFLCYLLV